MLAAAPLRAQKRAITLPDTNGANFNAADSARGLGSTHDYDALLGYWHFTFQNRNADGTFGPPFTGHWSFEVKPGGGLMIDSWRPDNPATPLASSLYTFRVFDPVRKVWAIVGGNSNGGPMSPGITWSNGKELLLVQKSGSGLVRIKYFDVKENHFLWRADFTPDNGKTWIKDYWTMEANRISK